MNFGSSGLTLRATTPSGARVKYVSGSGSKPQFFLNAAAPVPVLERPKSKRVQPRSRAWRIKAKYIASLARSVRAASPPPPQ